MPGARPPARPTDRRRLPSACTTSPRCRSADAAAWACADRPLLCPDHDRVPAAGAVWLSQAEGLGLERAGPVGRSRHERHLCPGGEIEVALPAQPHVVAGRLLDLVGGHPRVTAIGAV